MRLRRFGPLAALPLVVVTAVPSYAAVTVSFTGGSYSIDADNFENDIKVECTSTNVTPAPPSPAACAEITSISVSPRGGVDIVDLSAVTGATFPAVESVDIGADTDEEFTPAADTLTGSSFADRITGDFADVIDGGPGNDRIEGGDLVHGGPGDDILWEASGSSGVFGDAGDDRFVNSLSAGGNHGGTGEDTFETDFHQALFGIDGLGFTFTSTEFRLSVNGVTATDPYPVDGFEHLVITLLESGTQTFNASAFPGDVDVRGFGGTDTIIGSKKSDVLRSGGGSDTIEARDGVFDYVDCGLGNDVAKVDGFDKVVRCESITYARPSTSAIKGPKNIKKGATGKFTFSSNVPGSVFQCKIDGKRWKACSSPFAISTGTLSKGLHTLRVRAGYPRGNWDATPSKRSFGVA